VAANDTVLGVLHEKVARVMTQALDVNDKAQQDYLCLHVEDGADVPPPPDINPALLGAITKFLKDNNVTCAVEDSTALKDLENRLAVKKQAKRKVGNVTHLFDED
jgi:hypothetical protein